VHNYLKCSQLPPRGFNCLACSLLPCMFSITPRVLNCFACSQLLHMFSITPRVLNYPACFQLPHVFSIEHVCSITTYSELPHLFSITPRVPHMFSITPVFSITPHILNYQQPTCSQLPRMFSITTRVLNYLACFQLHHVFSINPFSQLLHVFKCPMCSQLPTRVFN
jgi:hypothetical protein